MIAYGYVRVSKERKGQVSPSVQRDAILQAAEQRGWEIVRFFEDIDRSATQFRPLELPGFSEMVREAELGGAQAVLFYRVDRAVREHSGEFDIIMARLERSGVQVAFTNRHYDDTPEGRFGLDLDIALSRLETRRLGARLKDMHRELAKAGKYVGGVPPYGWERARDPDGHQRLVLHPERAAVRRRMHELVREGWSLERIAEDLRDRQIPTPRGGVWKASKISEMLASPLQYGARVVGEQEVVSGRIEPLLSREEFERTRAVLALRRRWHERTSPRALRGNLVRCGACGSTMHLHSGRVKSTYRCEGVSARSCGRGADIREHILWGEVEPQVLRRLAHLRAPQRPRKPREDIQDLLDRERASRDALGRLVAMYAAGELSEAEWTGGRAKANERLQTATARLERARKELETPGDVDYARLRSVTPEVWRLLTTEEQHAILRVIIDRVEVNPVGTPPRIRIIWRW